MRAWTMRAVMISAAAGARPAAAAESIFPDKHLEAVVRKYVFEKKNNAEPLTAADVKDLSTIEGRSKEIRNLAGMQYCKRLALLNLSNNQITDLTPLKDLKILQSVDLSRNRIKDLTPLADLTKLQYLHLADNQVTDVAPLKGLKALTSLYLSNNQVQDIRPLAGLEKLWSLDLNGNQVTDIKPIGELKWLSSLDLKANGISDLSPLSGLTEIRYLFLDGNRISDIGVLAEMARKDAKGDHRFAPFWRVYLTGNPLNPGGAKKWVAELQGFGGHVTLGRNGSAVASVESKPISPHHARLQPMVGHWNVTTRFWLAPGALPVEAMGTASKRMILGGRFLQEEFHGEFGGAPFEGLGMLGYDTARKQYVSTWTDSMSTGIMNSEGTADATGKVIRFTGKAADPKTGEVKAYRSVLRVVSDEEHILEMSEVGANGKAVKNLEITYWRAE